jgi:hypothetical protein
MPGGAGADDAGAEDEDVHGRSVGRGVGGWKADLNFRAIHQLP